MKYHMIVLAQAEVDLSVSKGLSNVKVLLATVLTLILVWMTIKGIMKTRGQGDLSGAAEGVGTIILWLIPAAIGMGGLALAYGSAILDAATKLL